MCVIAVSKKGIRQPSEQQLRDMFRNNPDGAGYMYARNGKVYIHKGFMQEDDFINAVKSEKFTKDDPVVYHCRISTQAGVNPAMTHPFPLTEDRKYCEALDVVCQTGIAHNGVIYMTSSFKETRYSDTVIFITDYLTRLIRYNTDIKDVYIQDMIEELTNSKFAILDGTTGDIVTIGKFVNCNSLLFSNNTYKPVVKTVKTITDYKYAGGYYDLPWEKAGYSYDYWKDDYSGWTTDYSVGKEAK